MVGALCILVVMYGNEQCNLPQPNENIMPNYNALSNDVNQIAEIERPPLATHVPLARRFKQTATQGRPRLKRIVALVPR